MALAIDEVDETHEGGMMGCNEMNWCLLEVVLRMRSCGLERDTMRRPKVSYAMLGYLI
jgi:hypothetical protein